MKLAAYLYTAKSPMARLQKRQHVETFLSHSFDDIGKRNGFSSGDEYLMFLARSKGFHSLDQLQETLILTLESSADTRQEVQYWTDKHWEKLLAQLTPSLAKRKFQPGVRRRNRMFSELLTRRLSELGKTQSWLAERLGVSKQAIHQYITGIAYPKKSLRPRLKKILRIEDL